MCELASMRPRSIDRGNALPDGLSVGGHIASMRPRSIDRGNDGLAVSGNLDLRLQ